MSLVYTCLLLVIQLVGGGAGASGVRVSTTDNDRVAAYFSSPAIASIEHVRAESALTTYRLVVSARIESDHPGDVDSSSESANAVDTDEGSTAIPGALVAVIFGVFGLLVIARRSQR